MGGDSSSRNGLVMSHSINLKFTNNAKFTDLFLCYTLHKELPKYEDLNITRPIPCSYVDVLLNLNYWISYKIIRETHGLPNLVTI